MKSFITIILFYTLLGLSQGLMGFHKCPEGHHCIYMSGGAMLDRVSEPGWRWQEPFLSSPHAIQTTWQTDEVKDVLCGSSKGGVAKVDVQVVNRLNEKCLKRVIKEHGVNYDKPLIFDYVPSEVAQFCKAYDLDQLLIEKFDELDEVLHTKLNENVKSYGLDDCLEIKTVRMGRPKLSLEMQERFEKTELLKKDQEHEHEKAKTAKIQQTAAHQKTEAEAQSHALKRDYEMTTAKKQAETEATIKKSEAEADAYAKEQEARANEKLLTPQYLKLKEIEAYYHNSKIHERMVDSNLLKGGNQHTHLRFDSPPAAANYPESYRI